MTMKTKKDEKPKFDHNSKTRTFKSKDPLHQTRMAIVEKESERLMSILENVLPEEEKREISQMDPVAKFETLLGCYYDITTQEKP